MTIGNQTITIRYLNEKRLLLQRKRLFSADKFISISLKNL